MNVVDRSKRIIEIATARLESAPDGVCAALAKENRDNVMSGYRAQIEQARKMEEAAGADRMALAQALMHRNDCERNLAAFADADKQFSAMSEAELAKFYRDNLIANVFGAEGKHDPDTHMDLLKRSSYAARVLADLMAECGC